MHHKGLIITLVIVILIGGSFLLGMAIYFLRSGDTESSASLFGTKRVGVITVEGTILSSNDTLRDLEKFRKNDDIKSIILRIESPGGSVAASQEIFEAVKRVSKDKPIIASMGALAASGGYYIACAANEIFANPGTTTGSIGVRIEHIMIGDLMKWAKIEHETLKSGKLKDLMPFDKPISPEARKILQGMLDEIHVQFKDAVAKSRGIDRKELDKIADGRIFTGEQAKTLGLIDTLGGFTEAALKAAQLAGIEGYPKLVYPKKHYDMIERMFSEIKSLISGKAANGLVVPQPMLLMQTFSTSI